MTKLDKLDQVNIYASSSLSNDDVQTLLLLYQPLIGHEATVVFEALYSLLERNGLSNEIMLFYNLCDLLGLDYTSFNSARLRLEAIGLLETYFKEGSYVFLLKQPLTANQFLNDSTLGTYLESKMGERLFKTLVEHFEIKKFNKLGYKNITVSFDEVFETVNTFDNVKIDGFVLGRKPNGNINIKNHMFDYDEFVKCIDITLIQYGLSEGFKRLVVNTSYVYGYNVDDMIVLFNQSIGKNGYFDSKIFKKKASVLFQYKNDNSSPKLGEKGELLSEDEDLMNTLASTSIEEMLTQFWPGYPSTYLATINEIYDTLDFDREVINIMIFYVLNSKNGQLPTITYFKKAAASWKNYGIKTKEDAWAFVRNAKVKTSEDKKPQNYTKGVEVKTNDWVKDYKNNIEEGIEKL